MSDADAIAHVHRLSRAAYYGTEPDADDGREHHWATLLRQQGRMTWVAESAEAVVGFTSTARVEVPIPALELTALYVLPDHFGQGVGSILYDAFDRERRENEPGVLEVWAGNRRAVEFYVLRGWAETWRTRPGPQQVDFVTYQLAVRDA